MVAPGRRRRIVIAAGALLLAAVAAAALLGTAPAIVGRPGTAALAAALLAPPTVALSAMVTGPFDADAYLRSNGPRGVLGDAAAIAVATGFVAGGVAGLATVGDRDALAYPAAGIAAYLLAFAVFTARNVEFYGDPNAV